jgi:hypothetical protein
VGVGVCGRCGGVGSLLTFDIPQTALVATLDTYDFYSNIVRIGEGCHIVLFYYLSRHRLILLIETALNNDWRHFSVI